MKNSYKKKVVFISHSSLDAGAERSLLELLKQIIELECGIIPHVIFPIEEGYLVEEIKKLKISYSIIPYRWWNLNKGENDRKVISEIANQFFYFSEEIKRINPDIIYTHTSVINLGAIVSKELGIPHIWSIREYGEDDHNMKFALNKENRFKYIDLNSDFVIFHCNEIKNYYSKYSKFNNSKVVYTNVSIKNFNKDKKNKYFKFKNSIKISVIGRVCKGKGQKDVVFAVKELLDKGFDVELRIAGNVNENYLKEFEEYLKLYNKRIKLLSHIDDVEVLINESDIIVISSVKEAFGRVAIESMLLKKVVIGTNSGGTIEQIKDGFNGFLYEVGNYLELKKKILFFIKNKEKIIEMGENGFNFANKYFSKDQYSGNIVNIINSVVKNPRKNIDIFEGKVIAFANSQINQKDQEINNLNQSVQQKDQEINNLNQSVQQKDQEINNLNQSVQQKDQEINFIKSSKFWKLREKYINWKNKIKFALFCSKKFLRKYFLISKNPLVSVIIPIYDRVEELKESINSILNQTYKNIEIILVTDGSPEETLDVVKYYESKFSNVRAFYYDDNTGNAVRGRNKGIKEAKGKYIAFQDSDDIAEKDRIKKSLEYIQKYKADVVYGGWKALIDGTRTDTGLENGQEVISPDCDLETLKEVCVPCQSTVMVRKKALLDVGGLKNNMEYREDHELWVRLAYFGYKFKAVPEVLTNLRLHKGNNELNFKDNDEKWKNKLEEEYKKKQDFKKV